MTPPTSDHFEVQDIPNAGRGVIATKTIPIGTLVLASQPPAAHVIFRQYRKEVCACCYHYDRGRTLPVRDNDTGKVFCSSQCQHRWIENEGTLAVESWKALHAFIQSKVKAIEPVLAVPLGTPRPTPDDIETAWKHANAQLQKKPASASSWMQPIDPDILSFLLCGLLAHHHNPATWQTSLSALAQDITPYTTTQDLHSHTRSFLQLSTITTHPDIASRTCHLLATSASHNAFGLRSDEEYMGYAIYPDASYFNHSCAPNLVKRRVGRVWEFVAEREIRVGEECCITYLGGDEKEMGVDERRERLRGVWGFECQCVRCREEGV